MGVPVLLTANAFSTPQRENTFRLLRLISKTIGNEELKVWEYTLPNLRGYMVAVEGVVLDAESIKTLDAMRAHEVFAYMPSAFEWRRFAEEIVECALDGTRADGSVVPVWDDGERPKGDDPVLENLLEGSLRC